MEPYENGKPVLYNRKKEIVVIGMLNGCGINLESV